MRTHAGRITQNQYDEKAKELKQRQYDLNLKEKQHIEADEKYAITVNYLLNLAHRAHELFESSKADQKRALINFALSNLRLDGLNLRFELRKPFDAILAANQSRMWFPLCEAFRTQYFQIIMEFGQQIRLFEQVFATSPTVSAF